MDSQERITALEAEKKQYISMIDKLNNEKLALDQMLVDSIKQVLNYKVELLTINKNSNELINSFNNLTKENEELKSRLSSLDH